MDLSRGDDIDSLCSGCGAEADSWVFRHDGVRLYVCSDCALDLDRFGTAEPLSADHPHASFCQTCEALTLRPDLDVRRRCEDCQPDE